jgi:predicted secreted protein
MASINKLPNEILAMIFSYLDIRDLCVSVPNVCDRWRSVSQETMVWINKEYCPSTESSKQKIINTLQILPALRSFRYNGSLNLTIAVAEYCTKLKHLHIPYVPISATDLRALQRRLPSLESLATDVSKGSDLTQIIAGFQNLLTLRLSTHYIRQPIHNLLKPIAYGCPKLKNLRCEYLDCPAEELLLLLQRKKQALEEYYHYGRLSEHVFKAINECTNLKTLRFCNAAFEGPFDEEICITKLKHLKTLEFLFSDFALLKNIPRSLSLVSFSSLLFFSLTFAYKNIDAIINSVLMTCPLLKRLDLEFSYGLHENGLKNISNCKMLESLNLRYCSKLKARAIQYVADGCPQLQYLDMSGNHITRDVFQQILKCTNLRTLLLARCDLRGLDLQLIKTHITNLKRLEID